MATLPGLDERSKKKSSNRNQEKARRKCSHQNKGLCLAIIPNFSRRQPAAVASLALQADEQLKFEAVHDADGKLSNNVRDAVPVQTVVPHIGQGLYRVFLGEHCFQFHPKWCGWPARGHTAILK
jgi:hypothetical protein